MKNNYRKMLSDWEAPYLQVLVRQIETQSKEALVSWAVGYAERVLLPLWLKHCPQDERPQKALSAARKWMSGQIKLPQAKLSILACHAAASAATGNPVAQAAARAIGQCASTIHTARHCIGLPLYGALAMAYDTLGTQSAWAALEQCAAEECGRMLSALLAISNSDEPHPARINWQC